jgi:hypothetical protein
MSRAAFPQCLPCGFTLLFAVTIALLVFPVPASANPLPDAMVSFNVRPAGPPEERCVSDITLCVQMEQSTQEQGLIEFQIFIHPMHGDTPVRAFQTYLTCPEAWTLVDACSNADDWYFYPEDPGSWYLGCVWDCLVPDGNFFLAATLVFDVQGYGKLDTPGDCELWLDCPDYFVVNPTAHFGEAGRGCEFTDQPCATWEYFCEPDFGGQQLLLTAPEGGTAHGELAFTTGMWFTCEFAVNPDAPWVTGYVEGEYYDLVLFVDADASGLEPGVHETEMQLVWDDGQARRLARCVPVILTVEPASSVEGPTPPNSSTASLGLRLAGASPSSGPFVFAYENPKATHVLCGVYDASGREVASLSDADQTGGRHTITWRATDADGRRVRPGVYLVRLALDGQVRSSRAVVVR